MSQIEVDLSNDRIVVCQPHRSKTLLPRLRKLQHHHQTSKTIVYTSEIDPAMLADGFLKEGHIAGFFNGQPAYLMSKFYREDRQSSGDDEERMRILQLVADDQKRFARPVEEVNGFSFELIQGSEMEVEQLAALYRKVFQRYPTNIFDCDYLNELIGPTYLFSVAKQDGHIVCAAGAMINRYLSAEITDCATDPDYRGNQLLVPTIIKLEQELKKRGVYHLYSLTRALSVGMNLTVKRLGYTYTGTAVKNCVIATGYEDMNIWSKSHD